jgi:hypothetical protein
LYTVFNRVQESLIRGGIKYENKVEVKNDEGQVVELKTRQRTSRPIKSINQKMDINKKLWDLTDELLAA